MTARGGAARGDEAAVCTQCDGHGWIGDDAVTGDWSRPCPECEGTGRDLAATTMVVQTLSGATGTPVSISREKRTNDDGTPYYLANVIIDGSLMVAAIHANKAWRVREYLHLNDATGSHRK